MLCTPWEDSLSMYQPATGQEGIGFSKAHWQDRLELPAAATSCPKSQLLTSFLFSFLTKNLQILFCRILSTQELEPFRRVTAELMPEMLFIQVHENLLPWMARGQLYWLGLTSPGVEARS